MGLSVKAYKSRVLRRNLTIGLFVSVGMLGFALLWVGLGLGETLRNDVRTLNNSFSSLVSFLNSYVANEADRINDQFGQTRQMLKLLLSNREVTYEDLKNARNVLERGLPSSIIDVDLALIDDGGKIVTGTGIFSKLVSSALQLDISGGRAVSFLPGTKKLTVFLFEYLEKYLLVVALILHPDTYEPLFDSFSKRGVGLFNRVYVHVDAENAFGTVVKRKLRMPPANSGELLENRLFRITYVKRFEAFPYQGNFTYLYLDAEADLQNFFGVFLLMIAVFLGTLVMFTYYSLESASRPFIIDIEKLERAVKEVGNTGILPPQGNFELDELFDVYSALSSLIQELSASMEELEATNEELEKAYNEISRKSEEFRMLLLHISERLATIAEGYDESTGQHINRVKALSAFIGERLGLSNELVEQIKLFSSLHDIGKIFIPKEILLKPGMLTPEEWEIMKRHTEYAKRILDMPGFETALNIALYHHENYDGTGYPYGLKGDEIPIEAQIVKIVDVYDALRSDRPYKKGFSHEEAVRIIMKGDGRTSPDHFSPVIAEVFKQHADQIGRIWDELR